MGKRKIEDLTLDDLKNMIEQTPQCYGVECSDCAFSRSNFVYKSWLMCRDVLLLFMKRAIELGTNTEKVDEPKEPEKESASKKSASHDDLYGSTIDFMKRRGYKHCYMCGSDLGGGTNG